MDRKIIWSVLEESSEILFDAYAYPAADKTAKELSVPANFYTWINAIWIFDDKPFSVAQFMRYFPYGLAQVYDERLSTAVQQGFLASDSQGTYRASESGRIVAVRSIQAGSKVMADLTPIPKESLQTIGTLIACISNAAFNASAPPAHVLIKAKRDLYNRANMFAILEGIVAHCLLLEGYRDDCYVATWSAYGVEGHLWDVFDRLSQNDELTFDELHEKTSGRGVTREVHATDVQELTRRGWADNASAKFQITAAGKRVRAEVEAETERLFFAPWSCLGVSELEEFARLAGQLRDGLKSKGDN